MLRRECERSEDAADEFGFGRREDGYPLSPNSSPQKKEKKRKHKRGSLSFEVFLIIYFFVVFFVFI